jgi:hypothetical protein
VKARVWRLWVHWDVWGRDLVVLVAIGLSLWSTIITQQNVSRINREGAERRDQQCVVFERQQQQDVDALDRTYKYLSGLTARDLSQALNKAVLAQLPKTIRDAEEDDAPTYCHEKGVGLPEQRRPFPMPPPNLRP